MNRVSTKDSRRDRCGIILRLHQRGDLRPREGRDLYSAKQSCKNAGSKDVSETTRLGVTKTAIVMKMACLRRDQSRLYERQHIVMGATARVRTPVGAHGMRPYGPILCAAFEGIMQRGERGIRETRFFYIKHRARKGIPSSAARARGETSPLPKNLPECDT